MKVVKAYPSFFVLPVVLLLLSLINDGKSETGKLREKVPSYVKDITINEGEKGALDELRTRIAPLALSPSSYYLLKTDLFLIRWLRRESFNVDRAEMGIKNHLKWREEVGVDHLKKQDWSDMERLTHHSLLPRDREGKPAVFLNAAKWNLRQVSISGKSERFMNYATKVVEEALDLVMALGNEYGNVTQGHIVMNLKGMNMVQHLCVRCVPLILHLLNTLDTHYVGWVDTAILVNVPEIALPVINVARQTLHPITRKGIKVYGTNKNEWWKELLKYYEVDQIPEELGGNLVLDN